ncbi:hypothetical protein PQU92_16690 [Asticcacaulis sp. BYS171W]|uniref:Sel1 repeat family protein n=1 Tax=Asticcacaulis aquaticus TaxID=2984212 RepID=A0ABT5HYB5_9CAUL|nr:hypothetical protein [Asticcacaulis aquaticus]MDC7684923.1 hypothetical protein [Asticcacaulis aquaticus]
MSAQAADPDTVGKLIKRAENGDVQAQTDLGQVYRMGFYGPYRVEADLNKARLWLTKAAESGSADAALYLGDTYMPSEPQQSLVWYRRAADAENPEAYVRLCGLYREPLKDWDQALLYCRKAAEKGTPDGYYSMALAVELNRKDPVHAVGMYRELVEWGSIAAAKQLADLYDSKAVALSDAEGLRYTRLAVGADPQAYIPRLARYYEQGRGVTADAQEAARLYFHAARYKAPDAVAWIAAHPEVTSATIEAQLVSDIDLPKDWRRIAYERQRLMNGATIADIYPPRAQDAEMEGDVAFDCRITPEGGYENCIITAEKPLGYGFGAATLSLIGRFGLKSATPERLKPFAGRVVRLNFAWKLD